MSDIGKQALKTKINSKVYENSSQAITGSAMNEVLQDMVDTLCDGANLDAGSVTDSRLQNPVSVSQNSQTGKTQLVIGSTPELTVDFEPEPCSKNLIESNGAYQNLYLLPIKHLPQYVGFLGSNGTINRSYASSRFVAIPVKSGDVIKIDANLGAASLFGLVSDIDFGSDTFTMCTGLSYQAIGITTSITMTVPSDGKYLLLQTYYNSDRVPYNLFINSVNLVDNENQNLYPFAQGRYYTNGVFDDNSSYVYTTLIVKDDDYLVFDIQNISGLSANHGIVFYDDSDNFIIGYDIRDINLLKVPEHAKKAKLGLLKEAWIDATITIQRLEYPISKVDNTVKTYSPSLGNVTKQDGRINFITGAVEVNSAFKYVTIPIVEGEVITFVSYNIGIGSIYGIAFYDENDNLVRGYCMEPRVKLCSYIAPKGSHHCKYGFYNDGWSNELYTTFNVYEHGTLTIGSINKQIMRKSIDYNGLTWNAVGDSVTENHLYMDAVKNIIDLNYINYGLASSTIAINNTYLQNQSIVERVCGLNGNTPIADGDIWTIFGGINDVYYDSPLGALAPARSTFDATTVYGALQTIVEHILSLKRQQRLLLIIPHHNTFDLATESQHPTTTAKVRQAILDVAQFYAVPVLDLWMDCCVSQYNLESGSYPTTRDGIHLNILGGNFVGKRVASKITDVMMYNEFDNYA